MSEEFDGTYEGRHLSTGLTKDDVSCALAAIRQHYDEIWLNSMGHPHPLRDLWRRMDFIATQELVWLGDSLRLIEPVDPAWLRDTVRQTKLRDRGRAGFMLE